MIEIPLQPYGKGRVWMGDLPDSYYKASDMQECVLMAANFPGMDVRRVAVEGFIPQGPRALYGLLGAEFSPGVEGKLIVQVAVSSKENNVLDWTLASSVDQVHKGLPPEFATAVLESACEAAKKYLLGSGFLRYYCAAYSDVGSSRAFFRRLSDAVVQLLARDIESISEEELIMLFQRPTGV